MSPDEIEELNFEIEGPEISDTVGETYEWILTHSLTDDVYRRTEKRGGIMWCRKGESTDGKWRLVEYWLDPFLEEIFQERA